MSDPYVSILMLVHNAPDYTETSIRTVRALTDGVDYELVVVDNASDAPTHALLEKLDSEGLIDRLEFVGRNSLFAEGNNIASRLASADATHFLLLNSDIEVKSRDWLAHLLSVHERGITTYGVALEPLRVDGYCLLIDADLYREHPLDESHQWWWGVTKQQAALLREGVSVKGYGEHETYLHHFGGKSGSAFTHARGMDVTRDEVYSWFDGHECVVIDRKPNGAIPGHEGPSTALRMKRALGRAIRKARGR